MMQESGHLRIGALLLMVGVLVFLFSFSIFLEGLNEKVVELPIETTRPAYGSGGGDPTPMPTPEAIYQYDNVSDPGGALDPGQDKDMSFHPTPYLVYLFSVPTTLPNYEDYVVERKEEGGNWILIEPTPIFTPNEDGDENILMFQDSPGFGQYYYRVSSPGAGQYDMITDEGEHSPVCQWLGGMKVTTPTITLTPSLTYTPTITPTPLPPAVWQYYEFIYHPTYEPDSNRTMDIDEILTSSPHATLGSPGEQYYKQGYDYYVNWGGQITPVPANDPTPAFTIERKRAVDTHWTPVARNYDQYGPDTQEYSFREPHYSFKEAGVPLSLAHYYYKITLQNSTQEWTDCLTPTPGVPTPVWGTGIQIVTPVSTPTPSNTPTAQNLLENPKFYQRLVTHDDDEDRLVANHWIPFTWETGELGVGCQLPPTNTAVGCGMYPKFGRTESDAPTEGGLWSQMVWKESAHDFVGGVYQQVRVSPGFEYRVHAHVRMSAAGDGDAVMLGVALDGDIDPRTAEFWEWDMKASSTDPGNWGKKNATGDSVLGGSWIDREDFGGIVTPYGDTMTIFLIVQGFAGAYTNILFNDVTVELVEHQASTPTPGPRDLGPLWKVADGTTHEMILGSRGDLVATAVPTIEGTVPPDIPWSISTSGEGVYMDSNGVIHVTGDVEDSLTSCDLPASEDCLLRVRGSDGEIVMAVDDLGNLFVSGGNGLTLSADQDGDDLTNEDEVLTYETNPRHSDSDGDDTSDKLEVAETGALPLASWGANPNHKDLWVELDWMLAPAPTPTDLYAPDPTALEFVADMYDDAPLPNPDGVNGIKFHLDAGEGYSINFPSDWDGAGDIAYTDCSSSITYTPMDSSRAGIFKHYTRRQQCTGSSGNEIGRIMLPSTAPWFQFGAVLAHELGHNLGFPGDKLFPCQNTVMSYKTTWGIDADGDWLMPGYPAWDPPFPADLDDSRSIDYSHGEWLTLTENDIDERRGIMGPDRPIDFNFNGRIDETPVRRDFNSDGVEDDTTHEDVDEWQELEFW